MITSVLEQAAPNNISWMAPLCVSRGFLKALAPRVCEALTLSVRAYRMLWFVSPRTLQLARRVAVTSDPADSAALPLPLPCGLRSLTLHCATSAATIDWTTSKAVECIEFVDCGVDAIHKMLAVASTHCRALTQLSLRGSGGQVRYGEVLRALPRWQWLKQLTCANVGLIGPVDLTSLPVSLRQLDLNRNQLSGTVDLTALPASMLFLDLSANQLSGAVDLSTLPAALRTLDLTCNQLSGAVNLTALPASLRRLDLGRNQVSGAVDLTAPPASLEALDLSANQLSGAVDLTALPSSLLDLLLNGNQFSGPVDLTTLPTSLRQLDLRFNRLSGSVHRSYAARNIHLEHNPLVLIVDGGDVK